MRQLQEANNNRWIFGLMAVIFLVFPACFILPMLFSLGGNGGWGINMMVILFGSFGCIPVIILGGLFLYPTLQGMFVSKPVIAITPPQARVGERIKMSYQQSFKKDMQVEKLSFQLVLRETARYRRGTNTYTVKHEHPIDEFGYSARSIQRGEMITDEWQLQIPAYGVPTFKATNNRLEWYVKVHIDIKGWLNFKREYEISVLPERVNN